MDQRFLVDAIRRNEACVAKFLRTDLTQAMAVEFAFQRLQAARGFFGKTEQRQISKPHVERPQKKSAKRPMKNQAVTSSTTAEISDVPSQSPMLARALASRPPNDAKSNRSRSANCDGAIDVNARNTFSVRPGCMRSQSISIRFTASRCNDSCEPHRLHGMIGNACCAA